MKRKMDKIETYMFTKDIILLIFDFMKVVIIQLSNETRKIEYLNICVAE